jgi:PAS domain S-box-containing protein
MSTAGHNPTEPRDLSLVDRNEMEMEMVSSVEQEDFRLLVNGLIDYAIIRLDPQGVVTTWSVGAERLYGYEAREIIGQHFALVYTQDDRAAGVPLAMLDDARSSGMTQRTGWLGCKDGTLFWGDISITALMNEAGRLLGFGKVVRDLTERHEAEETLRRSEERYRLLVSGVIDYAIIGLDPQGLVETWNAGAQRIKGYVESEIVGQHFSLFYGTADRAAGLPLVMLDEARRNGSAAHIGWRVRKDGSRYWGDVVLTALLDNDGNLVGFVKITRDLTERHAAEDAAVQAEEREEHALAQAKLNQLRTEFMQSISHDLRTPITAIKGFASLLRQNTSVDLEQHEQFVQQIEDGADRLTAMVEGLLELAKLESGTVELVRQKIVLRQTVDEVLGLLKPILSKHHTRIHMDDSLAVQADGRSLERIMVNLISNAAKFSPPESTITIDAFEANDEVVIKVIDEGPGIVEEDRELVFERFQQGSGTSPEHARGSGLGLSMVRDYVRLHGGRVWVEGSPDGPVGTCIIFTLPKIVPSTPIVVIDDRTTEPSKMLS